MGGGQTGESRSIRYKTQNISLKAPKGSFLQEKIHQVFLILPSCRGAEEEKLDRRTATAGGKVNRLSLLYPSHSIHLVGLIKCQVEFLDI